MRPPVLVAAVLLTLLSAGGGCPAPPAVVDAGASPVDAGEKPDPEELARAAALVQSALAEKACPADTRRIGAEPPEGNETWCEKKGADGKPLRHGPYEAWHSNGTKSISGAYADGERDGAWTLWHSNGQRHQEWHYAKGVPDGAFREWDVHGSVVADEVYRGGKLVRRQ